MSNVAVTVAAVDDFLKPVLLKDLRISCRARGLNPGGSREVLMERVKEDMLKNGDMNLVPEAQVAAPCASTSEEEVREPLGDATAGVTNNYARPSGQNTGNFLTDKPSSRVLAPPGGRTSITLG